MQECGWSHLARSPASPEGRVEIFRVPYYTVEEAAKLLGKSAYTVRQWCLEGRVNAGKRAERRGVAEVWGISAVEIERYRNEGLLKPER